MSAAEQLVIAGIAAPTKKASPGVDMCGCGHEASSHRDRTGSCMWAPAIAPGSRAEKITYGDKTMTRAEWRKKLGLEVDACRCKRFHEKTRKAAKHCDLYVTPADGRDWFRGPPELVRAKRGGWFIVDAAKLVVLIENTKLESLNVVNRGGFGISKAMLSRLIAGDANKRKGQTLRTVAAIEQAGVVERGTPASVTITRLSSRSLDDDNLIGACKSIRDGIAEALLFDDKHFSTAGEREGAIPLFYRQASAGKRGVFGVRIEITWNQGGRS